MVLLKNLYVEHYLWFMLCHLYAWSCLLYAWLKIDMMHLLYWFDSTLLMYRFHSTGFPNKTKVPKLKSFFHTSICKIWTNHLSRLNKNEIFCNSNWNDLDSISLHKNSEFLKSIWFGIRQNSIAYINWKFSQLKLVLFSWNSKFLSI